MSPVKRQYDTSGRREQARARRGQVVHAARDLFEADGYRATSVADIATAAGVSPEMIYKSFGSKAAVAKAVFDLALAGDDEPVPVRERPAALAVDAEPDVRRKIALFVDGLVERLERSAKVQVMVRDGRHVDPSLTPVWDQVLDEGLTGMGLLGERLLATGGLRPDLGAEEVRDVLWNYLAIDHYERLVWARGWTTHRYRQWLTRALVSALCA